MKIKNKGKVYPSPSSSSSSNGDYLSVLKLLPAAILALASVLSLEDREVLAYLITRSIKTTATSPPNSSSSIIKRKASKKAAAGNSNNKNNISHKPPVFECDCFDCYMCYWFRWDSSLNRELIHQAIEAFEDHLTHGEGEDKSKKNGKAKRRDKTARRRFSDKNQVAAVEEDTEESSVVDVAAQTLLAVVAPVSSPEKEAAKMLEENELVADVSGDSTAVEEERPGIFLSPEASSCSHKGLARIVLPDVLGLFNSRLWSLWSPNA